LRLLLQDPDLALCSIAELMGAAGLLAVVPQRRTRHALLN
jgi:hypothetical protein